MPALGMAMTHGTLLRWMKEPGDRVETGDPVAEIETDKANMELESEGSGWLGEHLFEAGASVPVGATIAEILDSAPDGAATGRNAPAAARTAATEHDAAAPASTALTRPVAPSASAPLAKATTGVAKERKHRKQATVSLQSVDAETQEVDITGIERDVLLQWLETMLLIREFEERADRLALAGKIPGGMHSAAGQEAVAVGVIGALLPTDIVTSSHRSHHHSLAKGLTPRSVMAELYGKETGILGGRAGHMHLADFDIGLFGSNGIVGGGLGIAMGASLASKMRGLDQVAVGFFGDGGANTGRVWENINLAALWELPLIVVCENNLYAVETHVERATASPSIAARAAGFGLPAMQVDGQNVVALYRATAEARERASAGDGPTFLEALTYRYKGHNTGDRETYRTKAEVAEWRRTKDPITRMAAALEAADIIGPGRLDEMTENARALVADAVQFAEESPWPDPATATAGVTALESAAVRAGQPEPQNPKP
jgi:pyruvate dehydrogenase E1 component alpha subunit